MLPIAATAAVVLTHHLTALLLIAAYVLWLVVVLVRGRRHPESETVLEMVERLRTASRDRIDLVVLAVWGVVALGISVLNPGNPLAAYLEAIFGSSSSQLIGLSEGQRPKALFTDSAGTGPAAVRAGRCWSPRSC